MIDNNTANIYTIKFYLHADRNSKNLILNQKSKKQDYTHVSTLV